jgi:hypothetical protein
MPGEGECGCQAGVGSLLWLLMAGLDAARASRLPGRVRRGGPAGGRSLLFPALSAKHPVG